MLLRRRMNRERQRRWRSSSWPANEKLMAQSVSVWSGSASRVSSQTLGQRAAKELRVMQKGAVQVLRFFLNSKMDESSGVREIGSRTEKVFSY